MRILITGAAGQLGTDLAAHCRDLGDEIVALSRSELDIAIPADVAAAVLAAAPDAIINCAAWTAVDACEEDPARAELVNAAAVRNLADAAAHVGAHLVQVSTDYVFDGTKAGAYDESDEPNPQSVYGRSKANGEHAAGDDATVVRTSWVCSAHGGNMLATILRLAESHDTLTFVDDQRGRPTFTADLATALRHLAAGRNAGTYHFANHGPVSWFEYTQTVFELAGLDPQRVSPIATADLQPQRPAPRPANSVLATTRYEALGHAPIRHFREPLAEAIARRRSRAQG